MSRASRSTHFGLLGLSIAVFSLVIFALLLASGANAGEATYVGSEECADCHEDQAEDFNKTAHGKAAFARQTAHGCESCHGPGSEHVASPNSVAKRPTIANLTTSELSETCRQCHDGGTQSHWAGGTHEARGVGCTDCHSVHSYQSRRLTAQAVDRDGHLFRVPQDGPRRDSKDLASSHSRGQDRLQRLSQSARHSRSQDAERLVQ